LTLILDGTLTIAGLATGGPGMKGGHAEFIHCCSVNQHPSRLNKARLIKRYFCVIESMNRMIEDDALWLTFCSVMTLRNV